MEHKCRLTPENVNMVSRCNEKEPFFKTKWDLIVDEKIQIQNINSCPFCSSLLYFPEAMHFFYEKENKDILVVSNAIRMLFDYEVLFETPTIFYNKDGGNETKSISLVVGLNDIFYLACADYEFISHDEVESLYNLCFDDNGNYNKWGSIIWASLKRGMKPIIQIEERMRHDKCWDERLNDYPRA